MATNHNDKPESSIHSMVLPVMDYSIKLKLQTTTELLQSITGAPESKIQRLAANGLEYISRCSLAELMKYNLTIPQSTRLMAAFELSRRYDHKLPVHIHSPWDIASYLQSQYKHVDHEYFVVINLNTSNKIMNMIELYKGSLHTCNIRVSEVFKEAIRLNSASIIVAHNHPSGDVKPSVDDIKITADLAKAGALLDIFVMDHIIIANEQWVSLRQNGYFPQITK